MIPLILQDELKKITEEALDTLTLEGRSGEAEKISVFNQHLPSKSKTKEKYPEETPYPCVIIRLQQGDQQEPTQAQSARILFVVGVYDPDEQNQGYRDAMTILQRIGQTIQKNPNVKNKYHLEYPMQWEYTDEDAEPYFFAWWDTTWTLGSVRNEQVEAMI